MLKKKNKNTMSAEAATIEIIGIRRRLTEIGEERDGLADDAFAAKTDLMDEEHELHARMAELQNSFGHADDVAGSVSEPRQAPEEPVV